MISKDYVILNSHNVILIIRIILLEKLQDLHLNLSLMLKLFLVPYDLQCNKLLVLVIEYFQSLPKRPLSKEFAYFIPITNMVVGLNNEISFVVVIPIVIWMASWSFNLSAALFSDTPHLFVIQNFTFFKVRESLMKSFDCFPWFQRPFNIRGHTNFRRSCSWVVDDRSVC